ncbi:MAG: molybdate ABC transporter substrate-binding protein [Acidobacteria bacterium]|nr:molybdate ABC transporter substrate-binding protein [Acidobacteriota bacterium]
MGGWRSVFRVFGVLVVIWTCGGSSARGAEILVAAASDLNYAMREIIAEFEARSGHQVKLSLGSSGNFYAQIVNGAPFELFFSADLDYARRLQERGLAISGTVFSYAVGRLVVWVPAGSAVDVSRLGMKALLHRAVGRIAIANPRHAPYGRAAVAALRHYVLYEKVRAKLVYGENISQAAQFVQSRSADAGILALSLALSPPMRQSGSYWEIPPQAHPRLEQGVVILNAAREHNNEAAVHSFYDWVKGDAGRALLRRYGFSLPHPQ